MTDRKQEGSPKAYEWTRDEIMDQHGRQHKQSEINNLIQLLRPKARIEASGWASEAPAGDNK
ncbi:MAG: hypothetical protein WCE90_05160 [Candidatus Zixiibacteriota bacterium]